MKTEQIKIQFRARFLSHTALYLALAILLPIAFHAFGIGGRVFLPMHFPVLLAGLLVGPWSGAIVGLLAPLLSHSLTGMPPTYAVPLMAAELPIYGLVAGLAYKKMKLNIFVALLASMIMGRVAFGLSLVILGFFMNLRYSATEYFLGGAVFASLPGMAIQIVTIPLIVVAAKRARFYSENDSPL